MHPAKRGLIVSLLMFVFSVFGAIYMTSVITERDRAIAGLESPVPLAECSVEPGGDRGYVFIDKFEPLGEPVSYTRDDDPAGEAFHYLPVRGMTLNGNGTTGEDVFILYCGNNDADIDELVVGTTFKGTLWQPQIEKGELSEFQLAIQAEYPDLDPRNAAMIMLYTPTPSYFYYVLYGVWGYMAFGLAFSFWWYRRYMKQEQVWLERTAAFQRSDLAAHPKAVRLVHAASTLSLSSLAPRSIDPAFDVPSETKKKHPKSRAFVWRMAALAISIGIACGAQMGLAYLGTGWATGIYTAIGFMTIFTFVQVFFQFGITSLDKSRQEAPIKEKKAHYRRTGFHQYQDKVLKELGFRDIGDYRHVRANDPILLRTIYLSSQGNTLVEVGVQFGKQFFTIETITNDGKFLETHSLVSKRQEKLDLNTRHLRRSAKHEDILRALEEHDDFVAERTFGGSVLEAQFTEERFERFLAWADYKANDPQVLQESLIAS